MATHFITASGQPSWETPVRQGGAQVSTPLGIQEPSHRVIQQRYMVLASAYVRPDKNTVCDFISEGIDRVAYFIEDSPREPLPGGLVTFVRTFATVPQRVTEYGELTVEYPARARVVFADSGSYQMYPSIAAESFAYRTRSEVFRDFFYIGHDYDVPSDIPARDETIYSEPNIFAYGQKFLTEGEWATLIAEDQDLPYFAGAILVPSLTLPSSGNATRVAAKLTTGYYWYGQSTISQYLGAIWERRSTRIYISA